MHIYGLTDFFCAYLWFDQKSYYNLFSGFILYVVKRLITVPHLNEYSEENDDHCGGLEEFHVWKYVFA